MYTLSFTLKQHTPLIHFQPEQDGATLRATEVKPKLDRYLMDMVFNNDFDKVKTFLIGYDKNKEHILKVNFEKGYSALDYKLVITPKEGSVDIIPIDDNGTRFPNFFGNMGEDEAIIRKKFSFARHPITVAIRTFHEQLIKHLKKEVPNFFARNNFGTRQTKGFGSFYIHDNTTLFEIPGLYSYFVSNAREGEFRRIFEDIELVHKVIRSGINDKGRGGVTLFYMKPLIWQYFRSKGIAWEKRKIKEEFYPAHLQNQENDHRDTDNPQNWPLFYSGNNFKIVKDLMGLSSSENWRLPYNNQITKESGTIDRMSSPYFFKPIFINNQCRIYIDFNFFNADFLSTEFSISNSRRTIRLQTLDEFDIDDFFEWSFRKANIESLIDERYNDTDKARRIKNIFNQLRTNIVN